jgi:hypothetical protein
MLTEVRPHRKARPATGDPRLSGKRVTSACRGWYTPAAMTPSRRTCIALLAAALAAFGLALLLPGMETGVLFLSPAIVLLASLLTGHYVGEQSLARFAAASRPRRSRATACAPAGAARRLRAQMPRGGRLVATSLAVRPPPLLLAAR